MGISLWHRNTKERCSPAVNRSLNFAAITKDSQAVPQAGPQTRDTSNLNRFFRQAVLASEAFERPMADQQVELADQTVGTERVYEEPSTIFLYTRCVWLGALSFFSYPDSVASCTR